jgi:hypothetical protein
MPEIETYTFPNKELLALLIKAAGVREGRWMLQINFGMTAGNFGPDEENINPGAVSIIQSVGITKAKQDSPKGLVLDAESVNSAAST